MMSNIRKYIGLPYLVWILLFVLMPLVLLFFQSFQSQENTLTLANYMNFFTWSYIKMTIMSFIYALIITLFTLIVSYPIALLINSLRHKQLWLLIIILPTWINVLLKTYAFIGVFVKDGLLNNILNVFHLADQQFLFTPMAFIIVSVYIFIPFMILPIFNSLQDIDPALIRASHDLGASKIETFKRVIIPLSMNGVKTGIQVVFIPALSLFMITRLIAGNTIVTLGTAIEQQFLFNQNFGMGSTIGVFLVIIMILIMLVTKSNDQYGGCLLYTSPSPRDRG